ncbi:hypothetical protein LPB86_01700 [Pedobacter sp. MC2016-14]|uniref:hypothetical protein n=1 Tax=Pedobacter sp. MC2016-14 TaxID=2897327 RepID=UPI001E470191|nr:hypothetical protein [Pedobacter sp. MC2016-14]MCD0486923.1 hypothetical protein [Pedobacter sp. MC2016-14]
MKYNYKVGGISIASDIHFPELELSASNCGASSDAYIAYGDVPEHLEINCVDFPFLEINHSQYLLKLPGIGRYLVEQGNKITIQPDPSAALVNVNRQILTSAFAALSYQRGLIPFHGGMVIINGIAVLISGLSGTGKSTLLAGLYKNGHTIIADDISNLQMVEGEVLAHPTFPRIMIWQDAADELNLTVKEGEKLRENLCKYLYPINDRFFTKPVILKHVYILKMTAKIGQPIKVLGIQKIQELKENLFHPYMVDALDLKKEYSAKLLEIASHVNVSILGVERTDGIYPFLKKFEKILANAE